MNWTTPGPAVPASEMGMGSPGGVLATAGGRAPAATPGPGEGVPTTATAGRATSPGVAAAGGAAGPAAGLTLLLLLGGTRRSRRTCEGEQQVGLLAKPIITVHAAVHPRLPSSAAGWKSLPLLTQSRHGMEGRHEGATAPRSRQGPRPWASPSPPPRAPCAPAGCSRCRPVPRAAPAQGTQTRSACGRCRHRAL